VVAIPGGPPPTSLVVEDLRAGEGPGCVAGQSVVVHYVGVSWSSGQEFDASWERRKTFVFRLGAGAVIKGWELGVVGMKVGGQRRLVVPPDLGYGARAMGRIKPNETLVFIVDLLTIE
jgi:peptidylprolyl isomerase